MIPFLPPSGLKLDVDVYLHCLMQARKQKLDVYNSQGRDAQAKPLPIFSNFFVQRLSNYLTFNLL